MPSVRSSVADHLSEIMKKFNDDNFWRSKDGEHHEISTMGDFHLWTVMEDLITISRTRRRTDLEKVTQIIELYDDNTQIDANTNAGQLRDTALHVYDAISHMNTDAYGESHITHYKPIMIEAARRGMRDPYNPDYDKQ